MRRSNDVFGRASLPEHPNRSDLDLDPVIPGGDATPQIRSLFSDSEHRETSDETITPSDAIQIRARSVVRDWVDALVIAIVLAMFLRIFVLELYQIPSSSMTPTLIGGEVLETDYNGDGRQDLLLLRDGAPPLFFGNNGERLVGQGEAVEIDPAQLNDFRRKGRTREIYDRILVNKLAYWFHPPRRGDIVIFKVPEGIWDPQKPIYIKRCVGEPGETLTFDREGYLHVNGVPISQPGFFQTQRYEHVLNLEGYPRRPEVEYDFLQNGEAVLKRIHVPRGYVYVFGDNTLSSADSRYWGGVPLNHVKGRAFLLYWPFDRIQLFQRN